MSGQTSVPNYRETLFEYPELTPIHGEPSYESLRVLYNQIKANARSVHTTLGGGQHGHFERKSKKKNSSEIGEFGILRQLSRVK